MTNFEHLRLQFWSTHIGSYVACALIYSIIAISNICCFFVALLTAPVKIASNYIASFQEDIHLIQHTPKELRVAAKETLEGESWND